VLTDLVAVESRPVRRPMLCGFESHQPFAYRRGDDYFRCTDHTLLGRLSDGQLRSVPSSNPIAYQRGTIFYDSVTRKPVYYQSS
jgi:hypothetical protein